MAKKRIILSEKEPGSMNPNSTELAKVVVNRMGLMPRKSGSTADMYKILIELYERTKESKQEKKPELAVMTVEEMGNTAGITRQTMYDYLNRWLNLNLIKKTSYIYEGTSIIGYKLNGNTLEQAFEKAAVRINNNIDRTMKYVKELQKSIKNEKISEAMKDK